MTWNAHSPGYWNTGYDPTKGRYGIPAREHPDYRALYKALKAHEKAVAEWQKRKNELYFAKLDAIPAESRVDYKPVLAEAEAEAGPRPVLPLDVVEATRQAYASNLYRRDRLSDLSVRHDRAGKLAWEAELKRLGRK